MTQYQIGESKGDTEAGGPELHSGRGAARVPEKGWQESLLNLTGGLTPVGQVGLIVLVK